jgi:zinc transport system substrate-binding protein
MCPGHFDMRPSQMADLARCRLLVRFDFQQSLDEKLADRSSQSPAILSVALPGGMGVPESYLAACRQIADHFASAGQMQRSAAERRLAEINQRMAALGEAVHGKIAAAGLSGTPVLTSGHQAAFCRWLGLRPVAEFSGEDTAGTGQIDRAVKAGQSAGVKFIIANEPEGRRLADALADRLHARVVVFANFPKPDRVPAFDDMVRANVSALLEAGRAGGKSP